MDGISNYANDNEPNPWRSIGLQAALIVNRLRMTAQLLELSEEQHEDGQRDAQCSAEHKERAAEDGADIDQGLRKSGAL